MKPEIFTIGVYGTNSADFFEKILSKKIDTFIDVRHRRAVRGSEYSFVNSNRLQEKLKELGINYVHVIDLSPTDELRSIQKNSDKSTHTATRKRDHLDEKFISEYREKVLEKYDFNELIGNLNDLQSKRAVLFCVESDPHACHRSLIAEKLERDYSFNVTHL
jgi:uncharacterized protein (DUF488 family)